MLIPAPPAAAPLSSLHSLSSQHFLLPAQFLPPGGARPLRRGDLVIRMGGGPRTYPGGVSKWQWKRMQARKARQLLKARLARERQLFEMRKRAELRDAVAHLERPWDPDSTASPAAAAAAAPKLLSVAADDQLKALADRFHRPGGVDLWNDRDGPRVFESPATGATSARFFPKNAVHSVQPYALRGASDEAGAPGTRSTAADVLLALGGQGVRENAPQEEAYGNGDRAPSVEFMERDGTWEPLHALDDGDDGNAADWSSDDDDDVVTYESEGTGAMVKRNGRNAAVRWEAASSTAMGRDDDAGWSGDTFFSDRGGARQGHLDQSRQQRSMRATKHSSGRWHNALDIAGLISDSEMIQSVSESKWGSRSKDGTRSRAGRWSVPREDRNSDGFNKNSDSARGGKLEPSWGAQNKLNGTGNFRERFKPKFSGNTSDGKAPARHMSSNTVDGHGSSNNNGHGRHGFRAQDKLNGRRNFRGRYKPAFNGNTSDGEAPARHIRSSNGDEHGSSNNGHGRHRFGSGFTEDLEAPAWKPRRMNRARNSNGSREHEFGGTFRRGDNGAARLNQEGGRRMGRNGERRFRGDDYSLRRTSELHSSWKEMGSNEL